MASEYDQKRAKILKKKGELWAKKDLSKWDIDPHEIPLLEQEKLIDDKEQAFLYMLPKETKVFEAL